jgi:hypothetical protein
MDNQNFYREISTTMIAKRLLGDYGVSKVLNAATGPEGFAEDWVKTHLKGLTLHSEVIAKFLQKLYELGKKKTK